VGFFLVCFQNSLLSADISALPQKEAVTRSEFSHSCIAHFTICIHSHTCTTNPTKYFSSLLCVLAK